MRRDDRGLYFILRERAAKPKVRRATISQTLSRPALAQASRSETATEAGLKSVQANRWEGTALSRHNAKRQQSSSTCSATKQPMCAAGSLLCETFVDRSCPGHGAQNSVCSVMVFRKRFWSMNSRDILRIFAKKSAPNGMVPLQYTFPNRAEKTFLRSYRVQKAR